MPIATIREPAWAAASEPQLDRRLSARICTMPRSRPVFLAAEAALLVTAAAYSAIAGEFEPILLVVFCGVLFHLGGLDESIGDRKAERSFIEVLVCVALATCASVLSGRLLRDELPAYSLAAWSLVVILTTLAVRFLLRHSMNRNRLAEKVLIVGAGELAVKISRTAIDLTTHMVEANRPTPVNLPGSAVMVDLSRLKEIVERDGVSRVVIAEQNAEHRKELAKALLDARLDGVSVDEAVQFYERVSGKILVERLNLEWFIYAAGTHRSRVSLFFKRIFDIAFSVLLILVTAPLMAIIALAIKLDSRGPVFFRQLRVGLNGKHFSIFKFRSMRLHAERETGPVWSHDGDERITRVGQILRRFRLDEIPQAFNVLRGEMSVIGPRPERPFFVDELAKHIPFYTYRHRTKPGITGWAQVMYRYGSTFEDALEKLQYDFYYAKYGSFLCDVRILLKTVEIVLLGRGQ